MPKYVNINYWDYRTFKGVKYYRFGPEPKADYGWGTKKLAQKEAKKLRSMGWNVKIVPALHYKGEIIDYKLYIRKRKKRK